VLVFLVKRCKGSLRVAHCFCFAVCPWWVIVYEDQCTHLRTQQSKTSLHHNPLNGLGAQLLHRCQLQARLFQDTP
jgi:hypothetical protein